MRSTRRVRCLTSIASASWSYQPGQKFEAGAPGEVDVEEAERLIAAGYFEVIEEKKAPRRRAKRETATAREASETATED